MQRVRISLPYYREFGWEAVVLHVDERFVSSHQDNLLCETIPSSIEIHKVKAWPEKVTRKFGLGSLSLRSYYHFKKAGSRLLKERKFDLVFFSTTAFHVCALGRYWRKRFGVPFIVDMQDPWRNDFFLNKPKEQRPPKFLISHTINKVMEAYTMPYASGIMSVSLAYIDTLKVRYPILCKRASVLLPFGTSPIDFEVVKSKKLVPQVITSNGRINVVYMGAVTEFFLPVIRAFFHAFSKTVQEKEKYHFYFIGTNYSPIAANDVRHVAQIAKEIGLEHLVTEIPQRIPYFSALATVLGSDILFIPGSIDKEYNASKVYNNILSGRPIFSVFHKESLVGKAIQQAQAGVVVEFTDDDNEETMVRLIEESLPEFLTLHLRKSAVNLEKIEDKLAKFLTKRQTAFFEEVCAEAKCGK